MTRKQYKLVTKYQGMPDYAYVGLQVIQNEVDGATDTESYIPLDEKIQNFYHIPADEIELHPEHWLPVNL